MRKLYAGDCLDILRDELEIPPASIDLIYLDPPFNSRSKYNLPFKGEYKHAKPVMAFTDTWKWGDEQEQYYETLKKGERKSQLLARVVGNVRDIQTPVRGGSDLSAYLVNMTARLVKMRTVLKETGSIFLHCDPTASHYLKMIMDVIFGENNFRNEIIWHYDKWTNASSHFQKNHDTILYYAKKKGRHTFNKLFSDKISPHYEKGYHTNVVAGGVSQLLVYDREKARLKIESGKYDRVVYRDKQTKVALPDVWQVPIINPMAKERMGYPTQKPLELLIRIIESASNEGDVVLDPFCGCGTTTEAAEKLKRQWIGIDISTFATGLIRERIVRNFKAITKSMIEMHGVPVDIQMARELADKDKFEFEKWVCGAVGAYGMYHAPGTRGADKGVDGVLEFYPFHFGEKPKKKYAIIQVKGGKVSPDSVRALYQTVKDTNAKAGIMVCFEKYMKTVENNRSKETFTDDSDSSPYPVIQGFSVEQLLSDERLNLPQYQKRAEASSPKIRLA